MQWALERDSPRGRSRGEGCSTASFEAGWLAEGLRPRLGSNEKYGEITRAEYRARRLRINGV